jgi:hypothetical protein
MEEKDGIGKSAMDHEAARGVRGKATNPCRNAPLAVG